MTPVMKTILSRSMANGYRLAVSALIACTSLLWSGAAQAYSYSSYSVTPTVTATDTSLGTTTSVTVSFTMPMAMTTAGSMSFSSPVLYNSSTYSSEAVDLTNATVTSSQVSVSSQSQTYLSLTPSSNLASGAAVSMTLAGVKNPTSIEGTGTFYISGYESGSDSYNYFNGSASITYGTVDATVLVTDANGTTPISGVSVSLSYSAGAPTYTYEYFSGTTDSNGNAAFSGLTSGRTYTVGFYYSGSVTTNATPSSGSLTYSGTAVSTEFSFVAPNVSTVFKDASGTAVSGSYWYLYNTTYTVWKSGTTTSTGAISTGVDTDGTYTLYVADSSYNYYSDTFTVSGCPSCTVSGLANPITIPSPEVSGTLTGGGSGVSGVYISAHNDEWTTWRSSTTSSTGAYSMAFGTTDEYIIEVSSYGLPSGYFAPAATRVSVTAGSPQTVNLTLSSATKTLSGSVMNGDTAITDATVYAYQSGGSWGYASTTTGSTGAYSLSLSGGSWNLYIYPNTYPSTWTYTGGSQVAEFSSDNSVESKTLNIDVAGNNSHIIATFTYPDGTVVGANDIYMYAYGGEGGSAFSYGYSNASGLVDLTVPEGNYNIYAYFYGSGGASNYSMPSFDTVKVDSDETEDIGTIALLSRNSRIEGTVSTSDGGVNNVYVSAYRDGSWEFATDSTSSEGTYQLVVSKGKWQVCISAWGLVNDLNQELIYTGGCQTVNVDDDETVGNVDYNLTVADATLTFNAATDDGTALDSESGWASVFQGSGGDQGWYSRGCYVSSGSCSVKMSSGIAYSVSYYSYGNWYASADATTYTYTGMKVDGASASTVTADQNENQAVTLVMAENNVTVSGSVVDENGDAVSIHGYVYATNDNGGYSYSYLNGADGYTLKLSAGTWYVSYWSYGNYMSQGNTTQKITAEADETIELNLSVVSAAATISGTLLDPDGEPVTTETYVQASTSYGDNVTDTEEEQGHTEVGVYTDENGDYVIPVPEGDYFVTASSSTYDINPEPVLTSTTEDVPAEEVVMQFAEPDAEVTGTVLDGYGISVNNRRTSAVGDGVADVYISAYSLLGNSFETSSGADGTYTLPAMKGDTMYITAVRQIGTTAYYATTTTVEVDSDSVSQNLQLTESLELPEPQVASFDPQTAAVITMSDGAEISMPANSLTTENIDSVTVVVTPTLELPQDPDAVPLSYGLEISATDDTDTPITQLAGTATITFPYVEEDVTSAGLTEEDLSINYFEEAADTWTTVQSTVVDVDNNTYTISTDHFSSFAVTSSRSVLAGDDGGDTGDGGSDNTTPDGILEAPSGLTAANRGAKQVALDWDKEGDAASYRVKVVNAKSGKVVKTVTATKSKKVVKKLKSNKKYEFSVRSVGVTGSKSDFTTVLTARTLPMTPQNLRAASVTSDGAELVWKASRGTISKYVVQIFQGADVIQTLDIKKASLSVTGLDAGTEYSFRVQARFNKKNKSIYSKKKAFSTVLE